MRGGDSAIGGERLSKSRTVSALSRGLGPSGDSAGDGDPDDDGVDDDGSCQRIA